MPQVDLSTFSSQIFWLLLVFGTLYFLISKFIIPKAESIMTTRNNFIEQNIDNAENYSKQVKDLNFARHSALLEVNSHVEKLQKNALESLNNSFAIQQKELSMEISNKTIRALAEIKASVNNFYVDEPVSCIDLAAFITEKITNKQADKKLLEKFMEKIK